MQTKKCTKCGEIKNIPEFNKDSKRKDGFFIYCRECQRKDFIIYYAKNKDKIKKQKNTEENRRKRRLYEMSPMRREYHRGISRKYYKEHKEKLIKNQKDIMNARYDLLSDKGLLTNCIICNFPKEKRAAIHFHHVNPEEKEINIGVIIQRIKKYPNEELIKEVKKCVCMCANCHMLYHANDKEIIEKYNDILRRE